MVCDHSDLIWCIEHQPPDVKQGHGGLNRLIKQLLPDVVRDHKDMLRHIEQLPPDVEQDYGWSADKAHPAAATRNGARTRRLERAHRTARRVSTSEAPCSISLATFFLAP
ncbi:hypothetical protein MRX96_057191 [Rhipicephalus microplus]